MWAAGYGHKSIVEFFNQRSGANKELKDDEEELRLKLLVKLAM